MSDTEKKVGLVRRVFSEDRVARTKKALSYSLNGTIRTALPVAGVVASLIVGKMFFESASLNSFLEERPQASASEIYNELGFLNRNSIASACEIDTTKLQEAFQDADVVACFEQEIAERSDMSNKLELAPIAIMSVFCFKAIPKGAAYFQIAYREAMNSDNRVLKERDIVAMRAKQASAASPPPPTA